MPDAGTQCHDPESEWNPPLGEWIDSDIEAGTQAHGPESEWDQLPGGPLAQFIDSDPEVDTPRASPEAESLPGNTVDLAAAYRRRVEGAISNIAQDMIRIREALKDMPTNAYHRRADGAILNIARDTITLREILKDMPVNGVVPRPVVVERRMDPRTRNAIRVTMYIRMGLMGTVIIGLGAISSVAITCVLGVVLHYLGFIE